MKDRLEEIKRVIEKEVGYRIDTRSKEREITYGRAVFCKIARECSTVDRPIPLRVIGTFVDRDHASVLHNIRTVFPFAIQDKKYENLYQTLKTLYVFKFEEGQEPTVEQTLQQRLVSLEKENQRLKEKIATISQGTDKFNELYEQLSFDELNEVYDKMSIMVRAIKNRVYI